MKTPSSSCGQVQRAGRNGDISCYNKYCDKLMNIPKSIDGLYCSLMCKTSDINQIIFEKKSINSRTNYFINTTSSQSEKSTVVQKRQKPCSKKLETRISKRKQLLETSCPEDLADDLEQLQHIFDKPLIEKNQSSLKPLLPISSPESIDDHENEKYFDLKLLREDKDILEYMMGLQTRSAPKKLFDRPFPTEKNLFVVGQKLEAIDPKHAALFCVMTVSEVCGYRIKLHFDGYQDDYDFWVNADCPDLFYPGWCKLNLRNLQPPKNYGKKFDWICYLRECQALPAPNNNFISTKNISCKNQHKFSIGSKLEAFDKLTRMFLKPLICVATVVDILGNRIRIHLDGQTDYLDYWVDVSSNNIHPVGWCDKNGQILTPPKGYNNDKERKKKFNWIEYLLETNSESVPEDAFNNRPLRNFSRKMLIEVVDLVVPRLLRIAMVVDVKRNKLKILYDGFENKYEYWIEDDSPDIHPVGWSSKTNHPIELPSVKLWRCRILGCKGYGNSSNSLKTDHDNLKECPYKINSWNKAVAGLKKMPDRLKINDVVIISKLESSKAESNVHIDDKNKVEKMINTEHNFNLVKIKELKEQTNEKRLNFLSNANNIESKFDTGFENTRFNESIPSINNKELRKALGISIVGYNLKSISMDSLGMYWTRYNTQLGVPLFNTTDARKWSSHEVASYVDNVLKLNNTNSKTNQDISIPDCFIDQEINGEAFLMLNQEDLMEILKIPFGQALKIFYVIIMLRQRIAEYDLF